ncbi:winged helix-turn-helix transcriptional regulator [Brumimicrobium glaciale]|uniref:Winged helix-turn-helix transcriptional regulator n=1 Tax=Brumimicrobium glaciale TaxID=200475 RepID=A0A4Q4KKT3_9FLAO|nr:ATP-binding protein [Brumimicrobium glaciale]RYM33983.1 winged helix-turn-helix transcriptional regulator [Brumimicrobium glaciale]
MYRDQTFGTKTSEVAKDSSRADLDDRSIRQYRDYMSRFNPGISYNRYDEGELLSKMRVIDKASGQCTYGGLLFFGKRDSIETHFPDFRIDLLEIPGTSYEDARSRYTFRLNEDDYQNLWECYFECFTRLKKNIDVEFIVNSEGFGEELSPGLLAMREALVNLLMHADYFSPAYSRIRIFEDSIEFYNPGGLPKPIEELKEKDLSIPRNPIISKLFRMVRLAENAGFGFDKIDSKWKEYNNSDPIYDITFDSTIVKLITEIVEEIDVESDRDISEEIRKKFGMISERIRNDFGKATEDTFLIIVEEPYTTAKEIAEQIGKTARTVENYIEKLKNANIIERKGSTKAGYWVIKQ